MINEKENHLFLCNKDGDGMYIKISSYEAHNLKAKHVIKEDQYMNSMAEGNHFVLADYKFDKGESNNGK